VNGRQAAADGVRREDIPQSRVLPPRHENRQVRVARRQQPAVPRVDLVQRFEHLRAEDTVQELVRKTALLPSVGGEPLLQHDALDAPHRFLLGNAGVRDAVEMPIEQCLLVARREITVVRNALVVCVCDQVEEVFLEIGAGAADGVHFLLPDHFRERDAELGRAHRATQGDQHLPARVDMTAVRVRGVNERRGVEMAEMTIDEG